MVSMFDDPLSSLMKDAAWIGHCCGIGWKLYFQFKP